jgi:hypothetical protein
MIAAELMFRSNNRAGPPLVPATSKQRRTLNANQNNPGQQNQNPGQKPGQQQQGGGQKPGQQQQDPGRQGQSPNRQGQQGQDR